VQHSTIRRNSKLYTCLNKLYILHECTLVGKRKLFADDSLQMTA